MGLKEKCHLTKGILCRIITVFKSHHGASGEYYVGLNTDWVKGPTQNDVINDGPHDNLVETDDQPAGGLLPVQLCKQLSHHCSSMRRWLSVCCPPADPW